MAWSKRVVVGKHPALPCAKNVMLTSTTRSNLALEAASIPSTDYLMSGRFDSIYSHRFIRAAVCVPSLRVADPSFNLERTLAQARQASEAKVAVALFPELGISAYSNEDLFHQEVLLEATEAAIERLVRESEELLPVLIVGAPLRFDAKLFNCGVIIYRGRVLGLAPKTYLPNYREFYEKRQFTSGRDTISREVNFLGERVPFGNDLIFEAGNVEGFNLH